MATHLQLKQKKCCSSDHPCMGHRPLQGPGACRETASTPVRQPSPVRILPQQGEPCQQANEEASLEPEGWLPVHKFQSVVDTHQANGCRLRQINDNMPRYFLPTPCAVGARGTRPMGFAVRVRSAGQKYGPTCHQRDRADVTEFVTLVRLSSLGQHVGVLALAGYKRRKSALTANPIASPPSYIQWPLTSPLRLWLMIRYWQGTAQCPTVSSSLWVNPRTRSKAAPLCLHALVEVVHRLWQALDVPSKALHVLLDNHMEGWPPQSV